jgi:hypothetical protein
MAPRFPDSTVAAALYSNGPDEMIGSDEFTGQMVVFPVVQPYFASRIGAQGPLTGIPNDGARCYLAPARSQGIA